MDSTTIMLMGDRSTIETRCFSELKAWDVADPNVQSHGCPGAHYRRFARVSGVERQIEKAARGSILRQD
jgi:hypothetical protein